MIRKALPSDARAIAQVHINSWQHAYRDLMPAHYLDSLDATLAHRESNWRRALELGESSVWVAQLHEQVVGWICVGASRDEDCVGGNVGEVEALYVAAGHWQTGVGQALWNSGVRALKAQGFERLTLWVLSGNERARRFYRRVGCIEEIGSQRPLERGGVKLGEVRYGLSLPAL